MVNGALHVWVILQMGNVSGSAGVVIENLSANSCSVPMNQCSKADFEASALWTALPVQPRITARSKILEYFKVCLIKIPENL